MNREDRGFTGIAESDHIYIYEMETQIVMQDASTVRATRATGLLRVQQGSDGITDFVTTLKMPTTSDRPDSLYTAETLSERTSRSHDNYAP